MKPQLVMQDSVYRIVNDTTNRLYIGSSADLTRRWADHVSALRNGKHPNLRLQHAWNEDGEAAFRMEVLQSCEPTELLATEQWWMDFYRQYYREGLYNVARRAGAPMAGRSHTPAARQKISEAAQRPRRKGWEHTAEWKEKMSALRKGRPHPHGGHKLSAETRAKISAAHMGKAGLSGEANPFYGRKHSDETRKRMSASKRRSA